MAFLGEEDPDQVRTAALHAIRIPHANRTNEDKELVWKWLRTSDFTKTFFG